MLCPYCGKPARLVGGDAVYPHRTDLYGKFFYLCNPCDAWVGCHPETMKPLGRIANAELRRLKVAAHAAFDPLWKDGQISRSTAYSWLARKLLIPPKDCHIGMFNVALCKAAIEACRGPIDTA